jgi:hypothetical protein
VNSTGRVLPDQRTSALEALAAARAFAEGDYQTAIEITRDTKDLLGLAICAVKLGGTVLANLPDAARVWALDELAAEANDLPTEHPRPAASAAP